MLGLISCKVFASSLVRIVETDPITYDLFVNLAFYATKADSLWSLFKSLFTKHRVRIKLILSWVLISTIYLTFFPSIVDIMTGYQTVISAELVLPDQKTLSTAGLSSFEGKLYKSIPTSCASDFVYQVENERGNQLTDFCNGGYTFPLENDTYTTILHEQISFGTITLFDGKFVPQDATRARCTLPLQTYGYEGGSNCNPEFYDPQLNASWNAYIANKSEFWTADPAHYNCIAEKDVYQWGFSGEWILIALVLHTLWTIGSAAVWFDAQVNGQCYQKGRRMGPYRALTDLGDAIRKELGTDIGTYSEEELAAATRRRSLIKYRVVEEVGQSRIVLDSKPSGRFQLEWDKEYG